jgi:hypothetical protein
VEIWFRIGSCLLAGAEGSASERDHKALTKVLLARTWAASDRETRIHPQFGYFVPRKSLKNRAMMIERVGSTAMKGQKSRSSGENGVG